MAWKGVISRECAGKEEQESFWGKCENSSSLNAVHDVAWEMWAAAGRVFHTQQDSGKSKEANKQGKQMQKKGWGGVRLLPRREVSLEREEHLKEQRTKQTEMWGKAKGQLKNKGEGKENMSN